MRDLTQVIIADKTLAADQKNELLDQIAFLTNQATTSPKDRKRGMISAALAAITQGTAAVSGVAAAWQAAEPVLRAIFGP